MASSDPSRASSPEPLGAFATIRRFTLASSAARSRSANPPGSTARLRSIATIERFLAAHAGDIRGRVLEVGEDLYSRRFGADRIGTQDILHVDDSNPRATIIGDLGSPGFFPRKPSTTSSSPKRFMSRKRMFSGLRFVSALAIPLGGSPARAARSVNRAASAFHSGKLWSSANAGTLVIGGGGAPSTISLSGLPSTDSGDRAFRLAAQQIERHSLDSGSSFGMVATHPLLDGRQAPQQFGT
jgi:hypothetical protein